MRVKGPGNLEEGVRYGNLRDWHRCVGECCRDESCRLVATLTPVSLFLWAAERTFTLLDPTNNNIMNHIYLISPERLYAYEPQSQRLARLKKTRFIVLPAQCKILPHPFLLKKEKKSCNLGKTDDERYIKLDKAYEFVISSCVLLYWYTILHYY